MATRSQMLEVLRDLGLSDVAAHKALDDPEVLGRIAGEAERAVKALKERRELIRAEVDRALEELLGKTAAVKELRSQVAELEAKLARHQAARSNQLLDDSRTSEVASSNGRRDAFGRVKPEQMETNA